MIKTLRVHEYGGPLQLDEIAEPTAGSGQVVVRIAATGLNPIDQTRASGVMQKEMPIEFPWIPGGDLSGTIEIVGADVTGFSAGDEVFGYSPAGGAYAELIATDSKNVVVRPTALDDASAVAIAMVGQTAAQALQAGGATSGQTVLIHGGAGAVGSLAIQIAHNSGLKVITTAQDSQRDLLVNLGADQVIDYSKERFEDVIEPVDIVLDFVGGETQQRSFKVIKPGGVLVAANQPPDPKECEQHKITGVMVQTDVTAQGLTDFAEQVVSGKITPQIARMETLWNTEGLWAKHPAGSGVGKVVFTVGG